MAFQNSAGGIIIDAVLTDTGRKYMAQGKFKVVKFALGDDEVDYSLGIKPDGSASFKIADNLLPPVLEAFGSENSNIVHGLINLPRPDVLYLPILKINSKIPSSLSIHTDQFCYLSINKQTTRKLESDLGTPNKVLDQASHEKNKLIIESGIHFPEGANFDTFDELRPSEHNKNAYIMNLGLYDKYLLIYADSKLFKNLMSAPMNSVFKNNRSNILKQNFGPLVKSVKISLPQIDKDYDVYKIDMIDNKVYEHLSSSDSFKHSAFRGPRASITALNFELIPELLNEPSGPANHRYSLLGTTRNDLFGTGNLYDFIDTTIYIQGLSTSYKLTVPIRIIRYVE